MSIDTMEIKTAKIDETEQEGYFPTTLIADCGNIACRYYRARLSYRAILCVGDVGGNWDSPANNLYPKLCLALKTKNISALRVRYRNSTNLYEAVLDILAGIVFLEQEGNRSIGLLGHSFGASAIIQAAARGHPNKENMNVLVTFAAQSYGADKISTLGSHCAKLFIHGDKDKIIPPLCSTQLYKLAQRPKQQLIYQGASHTLDECAMDVFSVTQDWILRNLR